MANSKQSPEFLGGGPKFNPVGRDVRPPGGEEEPFVPVAQTGYWLRVAAVVAVLIVLAGSLFYLNDRNLGKTNIQPMHGGRIVTPDAKDAAPADPNFK